MFSTHRLPRVCLGYPAQIGYANLVAEVLAVPLDKGATRTDWARRPLSARQLHYAAEDVTHLFALHDALRERLEREGRYAWVEEDSRRLLDPDRYRVNPAEAWRRLGGIPFLPVAVQARARALCAWREERAIRINRPRQWVLPDKALLAIAATDPSDVSALEGVDGLAPAIARRQGKRILDRLSDANAQVAADAIDFVQQTRPESLDSTQVKRLGKLVAACADELGIAPELLATRKELSGLLRGQLDQRVTGGWRREVIGETLLGAL